MPDIATAIARIREFRDNLLLSAPGRLHSAASLADVKRLVIINSASRSGSSLLYALLGKLPGVYSLTGEAAPFYKLNTDLGGFDPHAGDRIPTELLDLVINHEGLNRDFLSDLWLTKPEYDRADIDYDAYIDDVMLRLALQWTDIEFEPTALRSCVAAALECQIIAPESFDTETFYLDLLERLHAVWPVINPFYYDIGTDKVALRFPFLEIPTAPPVGGFTLEEPPFVLLHPRPRPTVVDLANRTLLLKSTVDCYRMNLIERLFPNSDIRIIHLVRNPAATINGLYDGWLHRGFFSHNLEHCFGGAHPDQLAISGYSDRFPHGKNWWNFDLPVGWEAYTKRDLVDVCAFQWHSANMEILGHLATRQRTVCTVHFEDLIRSLESRKCEFERMLDFMAQPADHMESLGLNALPVVQSTLPPQLYRWKNRHDMIDRALGAPHISELAETFGYRRDNMADWL